MRNPGESSAPVAHSLGTRRARPRLTVEVVHDAGDWTGLAALEPIIERLACAVAAHTSLGATAAQAALALSSDARVRQINRSWRGKDEPTNVLSFPSTRPAGQAGASRFLGDIAIAEETVVREAAERGVPFEDHLQHLIVHGLLHLLGYHHESDAEAAEMEELETRILAALGVPDPYAWCATERAK